METGYTADENAAKLWLKASKVLLSEELATVELSSCDPDINQRQDMSANKPSQTDQGVIEIGSREETVHPTPKSPMAIFQFRRKGSSKLVHDPEDLGAEPPDEYRCTISHNIFYEPVVLKQTGHTFEESAIIKWTNQKQRCPYTQETLYLDATTGQIPIVRNVLVKQLCERWLEDQKIERVPMDGSKAEHSAFSEHQLMDISVVNIATMAWIQGLGACELLLTRATKSIAVKHYGEQAWHMELAAFVGNGSQHYFRKMKTDSEYLDWNILGQLWQNTTFLSTVLLPAMQLQTHDPAADRLREVAAALYNVRIRVAKLSVQSLATTLSGLRYLEQLLLLLGKHLSHELPEEDLKAAEKKVKAYLEMIQGTKGGGSVTLSSSELQWLVLHMSLQELSTSLLQHINKAIMDGLLPHPRKLRNKNAPRVLHDVVSLCQYLFACSAHYPRVDYLLSRKIRKLQQLLNTIIEARHQLHHPDINTGKWIKQNLKQVMEASAALLEGFCDLSKDCDISLTRLRSFVQQLTDIENGPAEEDMPYHALAVLKWDTEDVVGQLEMPLGIGQKLIARWDLVKSLSELLSKADPLPQERRITLYGVPGVGKTVTAVEVIKNTEDCRPEWRFAWLRGSTVEELQQGLDQFARIAVPSVQHEMDDALGKLKEWLVRNDTVVFAIDDATEETLAYLEGQILAPGHGRVLMTGSKALSQTRRELRTFEVEDSVALVKQKFDERFGVISHEVFHFALETDGNEQLLRDFLSGDLVGNLPLTVDQVARLLIDRAMRAGLRHKRLSYEDRQDKSRGLLASVIAEFTNASAVDASSLPVNDRHLRGLMGTVRLWVNQIQNLPDRELRDAALSLLRACGVLAKQGIPWSLMMTYAQTAKMLKAGGEPLPLLKPLKVGSPLPAADGKEGIQGTSKGEDTGADMPEGSSDPIEFFYEAQELTERAFETLETYGRLVVISGTVNDRSVSMLGAIQACIRQELGSSCPGLLEALLSRFHGGDFEYAEQREMELWRPSVVAFLQHGNVGNVVQESKLRSSVGLLLLDQGLYTQAEPYLMQALRVQRAELGERHPDTLASINNLGSLYERQGRYAEAEPLYLEALEGRRAELGDRKTDTLASINNLASLYTSQGRYADAERLLLEALEGRRAELGDRHPDFFAIINDLGGIFIRQGRYTEAEPMLLEALEGNRAELGDRHPDTLTSISYLGELYMNQGRYAEAQRLLLEALEGTRAERGDVHPSTLTAVNKLGKLYMRQGRYADAEPLFFEALEGNRAELGDRHPDTLTSTSYLGELYMNQGGYGDGYADAEGALLAALEGRRAKLGERHPSTLESINNLGMVFVNQGRYGEAEPLLLGALEGNRVELGERHPSTLTSINNLGLLYQSMKRYAEAEPLFLGTLKCTRVELGERNPDTLIRVNNLSLLYQSQGRYAEAEPLLLEALEGNRAELGERHPHTLESINNLGKLFMNQGRYADAEPLLLEALEVRRAELGNGDPSTLASLNNLGLLHQNQGRNAEAEALFLEALFLNDGGSAELMIATGSLRHPVILDIVDNLGSLYMSQGLYANQEGLTPLYTAADQGRIEGVQSLLIYSHVEVNQADKEGRTPLYVASEKGRTEAVQLLLADERVDVNQSDQEGRTPLYAAAYQGRTEAVQSLLACERVDVNQVDKEGVSPLSAAANQGWTEVVQALLAFERLDINQADQEGATSSYASATRTNDTYFEQVGLGVSGLRALRVDVNQADKEGRTPLYAAADQGQAEVVQALLACELVDVNHADQEGRTPLIVAAYQGRTEAVQALLGCERVCVNQADSEGLTALLAAANQGQAEAVRVLLACERVDVNQADVEGRTPLYAAANWGRTETVQALLACELVDINQADKEGRTPLYVAAYQGRTEVVQVVLACRQCDEAEIKKIISMLEMLCKAPPPSSFADPSIHQQWRRILQALQHHAYPGQ